MLYGALKRPQWIGESLMVSGMFALLYFVNTAPPWIMFTNWNAVLVGIFFMLNDILHRKNRDLSLKIIPAVVLFAYAISDPEIRVFGTITLAAALLVDWSVFDRLYYRMPSVMANESFFKDSQFWAAVVASNFACAALDSIMFSFVQDAMIPVHPNIWFVGVILPIFAICVSAYRVPSEAQSWTMLGAASVFFMYLGFAREPWVDPFAVELTEHLCEVLHCTVDTELAFMVDMISTSLFKVIVPFCAFFFTKLVWRVPRNAD